MLAGRTCGEGGEGILAAAAAAGPALVGESGWLDMVGYGCREGGAQGDGTVVCPVVCRLASAPGARR